MGRSSILMVVGFSVVLMMMGYDISRVSTTAYENYTEYYMRSVAHSIVASAANMAAHEIYREPNWRTGFTDLAIAGGKATARVATLPDSTLRLTVTSVYGNYLDTIIVILQPSSYSKFAYFSDIEGNIWWTNNDTVWGPFHTQDRMQVQGSPVFYGKVTNKGGLRKYNSAADPKFYGGYETGVNLPLPMDLNPLKEAAQNGGKIINNQDVVLTFNADGTVTRKIGMTPAVTEPLSSFTGNGAIVVNGGNLHVKGTVKGQVTIGALGSSGKGKVYLEDDIKYASDPLSGPSTDMLGIVAQDSIVIRNNAANNSDIIIQAALFSLTKGLGAENYDTRPVSGTIQLLGGITQYRRAAVGTFSGSDGTIRSGFRKAYRYDERLMNQRPPFFPTTGSYEVLSWYER